MTIELKMKILFKVTIITIAIIGLQSCCRSFPIDKIEIVSRICPNCLKISKAEPKKEDYKYI